MPAPDDRLSRFMTEFGPQRDVESRRVLSKLRQQLFERGEGAKVSRFEQLERIGHGGMGVVYRAWDPILRRRVAIKILHPRVSDSSRVLAEARALAAMSHPNIVQVLDVGRERNELFVVMEYVGGKTLSDLLGARRSLSSLAPLLHQVAEGLTAAHARGVVHHDIKPSNVLISSADVAQIADFGLARLMHADDPSPGGGTRGFAAPEQVAGLRSDARADVFSLTAIVYAAIYGRPPSIGAVPTKSGMDLPSRPAVSARMQRFLRLGLAPDPADRLASAEAWSTAFRRALRSPLRSFLPGVLGVAGVAALVVSSVASRGDPVCGDQVERWNEKLRAQAEARFVDTGLPFAPEEFKRADGQLTDASNRWALARQEACAAGDAIALACTDARRAGLDELISWMLELEAPEVEHVADALRGIPDPSTCLSPEAAPTPKELRAFDVSLARAHTLTDVGRYADAIEILRATPLPDGTRRFANRLAMHAFALARALKLSGDYTAAAVEFEKGYLLDLLGGEGRIAGPAAAQLAALHASELSDPGAGRRWIRNAQTAIARGHNPGAAVRGRVEVGLAATRYALGEFEQALISLDAADASLAKDDVIRIDWGTLLAGIRYQQGDAAGALKAQQAALEAARSAFGARHPRLIAPMNNLGILQEELGQLELADTSLRAALTLSEQTLGPHHIQTAMARISNAAMGLGRRDPHEGIEMFEQGIEDLEAVLGPTHPQLAAGLQGLATAQLETQQPIEAEHTILRILDIAKNDHALEPRLRAGTLTTYATALRQQARLEEALTAGLEALGALEDGLGPRHPHVVLVRLELAKIYDAQGDLDQGREQLVFAAEVAANAFGPEHPETLRIRKLLEPPT